MGTDTHAGIAAAECMPTRMPPSTSATTTSPGSCNPGRLQSISRMDGVPQADRKRSLWAKRSRPNLQACLKVVDLYEILIAFTPKFSNRKSLTYPSCSVYKKALTTHTDSLSKHAIPYLFSFSTYVFIHSKSIFTTKTNTIWSYLEPKRHFQEKYIRTPGGCG